MIESRRMGGAWVLGRLWERLEIGKTIRKAAARRRLDGEREERAIFAMVSNRSVQAASKLAGCSWVAERDASRGAAVLRE